jgi:hypothetical protein
MTVASLTHARLLEVVRYNPETGAFTWHPRPRDSFPSDWSYKVWNKRFAGKPTGMTPQAAFRGQTRGYGRVRVDEELYFAHRLAWFYMHGAWPVGHLDHINHNRMDNRIANLREVSHAQNLQNASLFNTNTSGIAGVCRASEDTAWRAYIVIDYKQINLGRYATINEAYAARKAAEKIAGFHENHGKPRTRAVSPAPEQPASGAAL